MIDIRYFRDRILEGAKKDRELWLSLTCAWLLLLAGGAYGVQVLLPQIDENSILVSAVSGEVRTMQHDLGDMKEDVTEVKIIQLDGLIFTTRQEQCRAQSPESKRFFAQRLAEQLRRYESMTGQRYTLPACEDLQ